MSASSFRLDPADQRQLAGGLFNRVWELLAKPDRSAADDDDMVHTAHASRYHWGQAGEPVHWARGEWLCSRVYAVVGRAEPARHHGLPCLALSTEHGLGHFDVGAAHEAIARACQVAGDSISATDHLALGRAQLALVTDAEERSVLGSDLASLG